MLVPALSAMKKYFVLPRLNKGFLKQAQAKRGGVFLNLKQGFLHSMPGRLKALLLLRISAKNKQHDSRFDQQLFCL